MSNKNNVQIDHALIEHHGQYDIFNMNNGYPIAYNKRIAAWLINVTIFNMNMLNMNIC